MRINKDIRIGNVFLRIDADLASGWESHYAHEGAITQIVRALGIQDRNQATIQTIATAVGNMRVPFGISGLSIKPVPRCELASGYPSPLGGRVARTTGRNPAIFSGGFETNRRRH